MPSAPRPNFVMAAAHGEPFPLPVPRLDSRRDVGTHPRALGHALRHKHCKQQRVHRCARLLNRLAGDTVRPGSHTAEGAATRQQASSSQESVLSHVSSCIDDYGPRPPGLTQDGCLLDLLKTSDFYSGRPSSVAPFDKAKLRLLERRPTPHRVSDVAPAFVADKLAQPDLYIRRSQAEIDHECEGTSPIKPYWDEVLLRDRAARIDFIKTLADIGLVSFRRRIRCRAGLFFVTKKGGQIRMVVDAREPNRMHRPPPHTALGTPGALAEQDWTWDALGVEPGPDAGVWGSSLDLQDSFYQFSNEVLGEDFGFDFPEPAGVYHCTHVWTPTGPVAVSEDDIVFPVFCGVPMGWSWALWAVHSIVANETGLALSGPQCIIRDKEVPPSPQPGIPTASIYVDNVQVFGVSRSDADRALHRILKRLRHKGLLCHEIVRATQDFEMVGLRCSGKTRRLRHTDHRAWRLYLGSLSLLRRQWVAGWQLRIWLGHAVHFSMLARPILSIFSACYRYVNENLNDYGPLWPTVVQEIRDFVDCMFLAVVNLGTPYSSDVFCSDSSKLGYALHITSCSPSEVRDYSAVRERWRFIPSDAAAAVPDDLGPGWDAAWRTQDGRLETHEWVSSPPDVVLTRPRTDRTHRVVVQEAANRVSPLPDSLMDPQRWKLVVEGAWRSTSAIHTLEARIALLGLRRASRCLKNHHTRVLSIGDNMSEILASEKGRAADYSLRSLIRRAAAYQLGCGIMWRRRHVDTKRNISDGGSRKADRGVYQPGQRRVGPGSRSATIDLDNNHDPDCKADRSQAESSQPPRSCPRSPPVPQPRTSSPAIPATPATRYPRRRRRAMLEVFGGCCRFTGAAISTRLHVACPLELKHGDHFNVLDSRVEKVIRHWIVSGKLWYVHFATPWTIWSVATGSQAFDRNQGFKCAIFTLRILKLVVSHQIAFSIGNPASSALFKWPPMRRFLDKHAKTWAMVHYCRSGGPYHNPTLIVSNIADLRQLDSRCQYTSPVSSASGRIAQMEVKTPLSFSGSSSGHLGGHRHQATVSVLRNGATTSTWKTSLAGAYPPAFCHAWARILARVAPPGAACPDGADCMSKDWEADLCRAAGTCNQSTCPTPTCPDAWVELGPSDSSGWGSSWGPWIPEKG